MAVIRPPSQRNADLEARLAAELGSRDAPSWLYATLDNADIGIWEWDVTLDKVTWTEATYRIYGSTREAFDGTLNAVVMATVAEDRDTLGARIQHTLKTGQPYAVDYRIRRVDGAIRWISARGQAMFDAHNKPYRLSGTAVDVTERKREETENLAVQQRIIEAQREALRELGAPIIPLADQTLAVPLIGVLGQERAEQVNEVVLNAVHEHSAKVVLTGVRPQVAQTLVELGVDLQTFVVKADLQSGIEYAARARRDGGR